MPMRAKFDVRATSEPPPPPPPPLATDTKYAIISGVLAGLAALLLVTYIIRATWRRRKSLKHYRSDPNISQRANLDGSNDGLISRGRPFSTVTSDYRSSYFNPGTVDTNSDSYNKFSHPRSLAEPPILPLVNSTRPLAITRRAEHTPSPSELEYRSIQNSPKFLPKIVIPSATAKPRSSKGVTATSSGLETPDSSPSVYSQTTSAGHALGGEHFVRDPSPPPLPPIPAQYESNIRLGRADTRAIASLLKSRADRTIPEVTV